MDIKTKFDLGQMVWPISRKKRIVSGKCTICNGTGKVLVLRADGTVYLNEHVPCPECHGEGEVKTGYVLEHVVAEGSVGMVEYISIAIDNAGKMIIYGIKRTVMDYDGIWCEHDLFANREDAMQECNKRNLGIK